MPSEEESTSDDEDSKQSEEEEDEDEEEESEDDDDGDAESSSESGPPPPPRLIDSRFRVKDQIGKGSYSVVHRGIDRERGDKVAVKLEWVKAEKGKRLLLEAKMYGMLGKCKDAPSVRWAGRQGPWNILVMDLQGPSLDARFTACGRRFNLKTVLMLGEQMIDRIQYVHSRGLVHRDIKPHNFLMGKGEQRGQVLIMDLGLSKRFREPKTGKHIPMAKNRGVTGTVRYASLNVHKGREPSRRDDLEAIGYILLQFLRGTLPWQGLTASSKPAKHEKIRQCKKHHPMKKLVEGHPEEFGHFLRYCRGLKFSQRPDYEYLRGLLRNLFFRERFKRDHAFDWSEADGTASTGYRSRGDQSPSKRQRSGSQAKRKAVEASKSPGGKRRREKSKARKSSDY